MTARVLTAQRPGPVSLGAVLPMGSVRVVADPHTTVAQVQLRATSDDPTLNGVVERAVLRWDDGGALIVSVPELPATGPTVIRHGGMTVISTGVVNVGGGRVVIGSGAVVGAGAMVVVGALEVVATVPEGCDLEVRGEACDLTATGLFNSVCVKTVSGDVQVDAAHTLNAATTSGDVMAGAVDISASIRTVSGDVELSAFAGTAALGSVSGDIRVGAYEAASITARSVSGDVRVIATESAQAAGVSVWATSVSGRVVTPTSPTGRRGGSGWGEC